jgi:hypothetical protein
MKSALLQYTPNGTTGLIVSGHLENRDNNNHATQGSNSGRECEQILAMSGSDNDNET